MTRKTDEPALATSSRSTANASGRSASAASTSATAAAGGQATAPEAAPVLDLETRITGGHHQSLVLWLRMLSCTNRVENEIRSRLRAEFGITLPRFDLMAQLERQPEGLRMGELSKRMMVTGGNVTGITDQLVAENLVVREPAPDDRRAFIVKLTPAGRRAFARMAQVHEEWIAELFSGLPPDAKTQLIDLLSTLKGSLTAPPAA
jgi:DNA-binding MarR family transcriptional regulator